MEGLIELVLLLVITAAGWLLLKPALPPFLTRIGNWRVHHVLQRSLPASHYKLFRDLVLRPEVPGEPATPTADEVIVSPYGVFVIANEHMAGVIAGGPGDSRWTCTGWRAQRTFPNPLLRNQVCIRALRKRLQLDASCFHSLVVVSGRASLPGGLPANVTPVGGMLPFVQVRTGKLLGFEEAERVARLLDAERVSPGVQTAAAQLAALRGTHGSRFNARQAVLGLGLMAALLFVAGGLVQHLAVAPGQFPSSAAAVAPNPFAERAPPPRIDLPGVARPAQAGQQPVPAATAPVTMADTAPRAGQSPAALEQRLAWEASLKCGYAAESRHCACFGPEGRKAALDYDSCKALADRR